MPARVSSYQEKRRRGLVPHHYDRDSKSFQAGAYKHWSGHRQTDAARVKVDREFLERAREARCG